MPTTLPSFSTSAHELEPAALSRLATRPSGSSSVTKNHGATESASRSVVTYASFGSFFATPESGYVMPGAGIMRTPSRGGERARPATAEWPSSERGARRSLGAASAATELTAASASTHPAARDRLVIMRARIARLDRALLPAIGVISGDDDNGAAIGGLGRHSTLWSAG